MTGKKKDKMAQNSEVIACSRDTKKIIASAVVSPDGKHKHEPNSTLIRP
jgi:hypothetical protein